VPDAAQLVIFVSHLPGPKDDRMRTELELNGKAIDQLNRHGAGAAAEPRPLCIDLPRAALRKGDNAVELRQRPDGHADCMIHGVALAVPGPVK